MSTLPLVSAPPHPDAWHDVRTPGGYEWWYFDAEDAQSDTQVVGILLDGFVFHPGYLRRHYKYLKNPTRNAPASARDFPCAYFVIYEKGKIAAQFMTQFPPGSLKASTTEPRVTLGDNHLTPDATGLNLKMSGHPWRITGRGPQTLRDSTLSVNWRMMPASVHQPEERLFLSRRMTGADHNWVLANPHMTFEADVRLTGKDTAGSRIWNLKGRCYHDHNFGTAPLGPGLKRWIWGRALFDDACYTFHYAIGQDPTLPPEPHLVRVDASGLTDLRPAAVEVDFSRKSALLLDYPARVSFGPALRLSDPRMIDLAPFYMRLMYKAECDGRVGQAFCEVAYPHRLRWPVLGRMVEMSFDKRT